MNSQVILYIARIFAIFVSLPVHEFAHGYSANLLGDKTAKSEGRLSLNPLRHLDPVGTAAILFCGFGWAKPVPVNANNFSKPKRDMALVALAGPVSNLVLALIGICLLKINLILLPVLTSGAYLPSHEFITIFTYFSIININLAVFNLIPIPPLDGSRLVTYFIPQPYYNLLMRYEIFGTVLVMALLFLGVLDWPMKVAGEGFLSFLDFITQPIDMLGGLAH